MDAAIFPNAHILTGSSRRKAEARRKAQIPGKAETRRKALRLKRDNK